MIALALAVVLAQDADIERGHRFSVSTALLTVLPTTRIGSFPVAIETDVGFMPIRFVRLLAIASLESLVDGRSFSDMVPPNGLIGPFTFSALTGAEGIVTALQPIELSGGAAIGVSQFQICQPGFCFGNTQARVNVRALLGYQFNAWLSAGFFASFNEFINFPAPPWFETGARVSVHL